MAKYKRVLIKLCGGDLASKEGESFGVDNLEHITSEIISLTKINVEVSVVVGVGNFFRSNLASQWGINGVEADNIGTNGNLL